MKKQEIVSKIEACLSRCQKWIQYYQNRILHCATRTENEIVEKILMDLKYEIKFLESEMNNIKKEIYNGK